MPGMIVALVIAPHTGARLAEIGFLLVLIAGVWMVAAEAPALNLGNLKGIGAGVLLAVGGLLLIIATHWGHFGSVVAAHSQAIVARSGARVALAVAIAPHTGVRLAEVGFLLMTLAGIGLVVAEIPALGGRASRTVAAGFALAVGAALLVVATHWGQFG